MERWYCDGSGGCVVERPLHLRSVVIILAQFSLQTTHVLYSLYTLNTRVVLGETSTKTKKWQDRVIASTHFLCSCAQIHTYIADPQVRPQLSVREVASKVNCFECLTLLAPLVYMSMNANLQPFRNIQTNLDKPPPLFPILMSKRSSSSALWRTLPRICQFWYTTAGAGGAD